MRTIDEVEQWARDPANVRRDGGSWNGWCESFVYRAGGFTQSFPSAMLAGDASGPLDPDWRTARRGELHYWAGVGGDGHVAFELGGGLLLMASASVSDSWGVDMGTIGFPAYSLKRIPYRGHTPRHGVETLATVTTAADGPLSPVSPAEIRQHTNEEHSMILLTTPEHGHYTVAPGFAAGLPSTRLDDAIRDQPKTYTGLQVWPIGPDDLAGFIFALSGCPSVPAVGTAWHAGAAAG